MRGIITKNKGVYTVTIKSNGETVFKQNNINTILAAQLILKGNKVSLDAIGTDAIEATPEASYKRSYPELEGKVISWSNRESTYKGRVIGCDYWIGITIVDAYDKKHYLTCISGPNSPRAKEILSRKPRFFDNYDEKFLFYIASIEEGEYSTRLNPHSNNAGGYLSASNCSFGQ